MNYSNQAVFGFKKHSKSPFLANAKATELFGDENGVIIISRIFSDQKYSDFWRKTIETKLNKDGVAVLYDVPLRTFQGQSKIFDIQMGYADEETKILFVEFFPKEDTRMDQAMSQVNQSLRAEGIFRFDEDFTLIHCNQLLLDVFEADESSLKSKFGNRLTMGIPEDIRQKLIQEIRNNFKKSSTYFKQLKIVTINGCQHWYSLEIQKRTLDDTLEDKLMVSLVNIENQVETEEKLSKTSQLFDIMQTLSDELLWQIDIPQKILIRKANTKNRFVTTTEVTNFPESIYNSDYVYPEDKEIYKIAVENMMNGQEGDCIVRLKPSESDFYEYRKLIWLPLYDDDGSVTEVYGKSLNIHDKMELEHTISHINKQFDIIEKITNETLLFVDFKTRMLMFRGNQASEICLDEMEENFPDCMFPYIFPDELEHFKKFSAEILLGIDKNITFRMKVASQEEKYEWFQMDCYMIYDSDGHPEQIVGTLKNVEMQQEMLRRANTDLLTGCLNKMAFLEKVTEILESSKNGEKHALFFLDLDNFKYVNDNLGHAFGDFLLQELGHRLRNNVRSHDLIGRVGGDEFVIFLQNMQTNNILLGKAKIFLSTISEDFIQNDKHHCIHGSLGISIFPEHGNTYEELYHHADLALYRSKGNGKNTVTLYENQ